MKKAEIQTIKGSMYVEFFENDAPNTVKNFIGIQFGKIMSLLFHKKKIKNIL